MTIHRPVSHVPILVFAATLAAGAAAGQPAWKPIAPGVKAALWSGSIEGGSRVECAGIQVSGLGKIRCVQTYRALWRRAQSAPTDYSLHELESALRPIAIANGGFTSSYAHPIPTGLLVENHVVASSPIKSRTLSGVFWVDDGGRAHISRRDSVNPRACAYAIQAGPMLLDTDGHVAILRAERERTPYRRTVVALDRKGRVLLLATSETSLFDLATLLAKGAGDGGLDCVAALNLDGDVDSGMIFHEAGSAKSFGATDVLIASAIGVFAR